MKNEPSQFEYFSRHKQWRHPERSRLSGGAKDLARAATKISVLVVLLASLLSAQDMPMFRWENFTTANGLPDNHVYSVLVDGGRIWAGTDNGLGLFENGKWTIYRPNPDAKEHSLAHQAVLSLALDKNTGDVWAGTMGGLSRISAGRIDTYTQLNSGLSNDIVYGVGVQGDCCRRQPLKYPHGTVVLIQRLQHTDVRDLDLCRQPDRRQGLLRRLGWWRP